MTDERLDVQQVVSRFFLAMDRFDWDAIAAVVDDEMTLVAGAYIEDPPAPASRDRFMQELIDRNAGFSLPGHGSYHGNSGHVVDVDGDSAHVRSHMYGSHWVGPEPTDEFHVLGMYDVELRRTAHGWRIRRLAVIPLFTRGAPAASIMARAHDAWHASAARAGD